MINFHHNKLLKYSTLDKKKNPWCWLLKGSFILDHTNVSVRCTWLMIFQLHTWKTRVYSHVPSLNIQSCIRGCFFSTFRFKNSILAYLDQKKYTSRPKWVPYARHYKPRPVYFFTPFPKTIYVLWPLALCMACIQERLLIKSGLWWRAYGTIYFLPLKNSCYSIPHQMLFIISWEREKSEK